MTVLTTLTAQNTKTVSDIMVVPSKFFSNQLITTLEDLQPDVIKIGVLFDKSIIEIVYNNLKTYDKPIVVDPVLYSGTGISLLRENAYESYKKKIIPLSFLITPNLKEAEIISEKKILKLSDLSKVAAQIIKLGASNVIIKGVPSNKSKNKISDFLYKKDNEESYRINHSRIKVTETHGTGCNFSSALASFLANGHTIHESFCLANNFVYEGLKNPLKIGDGLLINNPIHKIYQNSEKYKVLVKLQSAIESLEDMNGFFRLIPETKTNFVYSLDRPKSVIEVAGIIGRITSIDNKIRIPNIVRFGASSHVANALITANEFNSLFRSAINIRNNEILIRLCERNFRCSSYSRLTESEENRSAEGLSIKWGIKEALKTNPKAELVYHDGGYGKEAMIILFGNDPSDVLDKIKLIMEKSKDN